ncbi:MAG: hypothetical protein JOY89_20345 [Solirubrobacterales bacterium]|nr:hypothetical protein [Solirubrobacterales bacterium]
MGTTRMAYDARVGVVDADCRVHGVHGLYIAGSSVFPTAGHANPTVTLVALAIRLSFESSAHYDPHSGSKHLRPRASPRALRKSPFARDDCRRDRGDRFIGGRLTEAARRAGGQGRMPDAACLEQGSA